MEQTEPRGSTTDKRWLVSFCNTRAKLVLATVGPEGIDRVVEIADSEKILKGVGITGICHDGEGILTAIQARTGTIAILDRELAVRSVVLLDELLDLHGITAVGSRIVAVSTGTNQVVSFDRLGAPEPRVVWQDSGACCDRHHLNDIYLCPDGRLLLCRFGELVPGRMRCGSVVVVETDEVLVDGLREPHSPCWWDGTLYVLESATGDLLSIRPGFPPRRVLGILGYARGLAVDDDWIVIGCSGYRDLSRSHLGGLRLPPIIGHADGANLLTRSGICFYERRSGTAHWVDTTTLGLEIYQIISYRPPAFEQ
jgi:hypothetical protein